MKNTGLVPSSYLVGYSDKIQDHIKISFASLNPETRMPDKWAIHSGGYFMDKNTGEFVRDVRVSRKIPLLLIFLFESEYEAYRVYLVFHRSF